MSLRTMDKAALPKSVLETILDWSEQRPVWQRDALRRIVATGRPDDDAIAEITLLCKKGQGAKGIELKPVPLARKHLPSNPPDGVAIRLISIKDVVGVNQLATDQELTFEPDGLTVVYGQNGAGKSGYARILKRACRARHAGQIMSDAFNPGRFGKATATICISKAGVTQDPVTWIDTGQPDPELSAISVFDKDCASVHVQKENEVAFRPFGLDIPDDLADACQRVKQRLTEEQRQLEAQRNPIFVKPSWRPQTEVGKLMGRLFAASHLEALERLGNITEAERIRHARLTEDLLKDPVVAAAQQRLFADNITQLAAVIRACADGFSDNALDELKRKADDARAKRAAATLAAERAFGDLPIPGVGAEAWRELWEAARHYAEHLAYPGQPFPPERDGVCVLCQQPLDTTARARMSSFETFIRDDTEAKAETAETGYDLARRIFVANRINIGAVAQTRRRIGIENPALARKVIRFLASARLRRTKCLAALAVGDAMELQPLAASPIADLAAFEEGLRVYARQLDNAADAEGRRRLQAELDELTDRMAVNGLLPIATSEVGRLNALKLVSNCLSDTTTNAITRLGNEIADNIITPKMRDQFQSEIVRLAAEKVRVEVVRSGGQYGSPQYQVRFFANPRAKVQ